jgi:hypothetical protein
MITVRIETESEEEMDRRIQMFYDTYPRMGYMTSLDKSYYDERKAIYIAEMSRLNSCD